MSSFTVNTKIDDNEYINNMKRRHVNLGEIGYTPKKIMYFDSDSNPSSIGDDSSNAFTSTTTPLKSALTNKNTSYQQPLSANSSPQSPSSSSLHISIPTRPKTSRGKSRPSPDEMTDYVIPSPPQNNFNSSIFRFDDDDTGSNTFDRFCNEDNFNHVDDDDAIVVDRRDLNSEKARLVSELDHLFKQIISR